MHNIEYNGQAVAACEIKEITGKRTLGRHALVVRLRLDLSDFRHANKGHLVWFGGELQTPAGIVRLHPHLEPVRLAKGEPRDVYLEADLDHAQMRLVDDARLASSGNLDFTLQLRVLINVGGDGTTASYVAVPIALNTSHWIGILADSGFDERQVLDLVISYPGQPEHLAEAAVEVKRAWTCYRKVDWHGAFTHCRRAFEHLELPGRARAFKEEHNLADRLRNVIAAVRDTLQAGPHVGIGDPGRHDAYQILVWTSSILDALNRCQA